jgi:hypothetical protein
LGVRGERGRQGREEGERRKSPVEGKEKGRKRA